MTKSDLKDALPSLSHLDYSKVPTDNLSSFLKDIFQNAEHIINSIPPPPSSGSPPSPPSKPNTAKSPEDTLATPFPPNDIDERNSKTQSAWGKPVKVTQKENPLGIAVYKMSGHDGHGAWFARRSVHVNLGFTRWKKNMQREFAESMAQEGGAGAGAVRGIGADRRLEKEEAKDLGKLEVWQLSAQFPGPTTPREFHEIVISSENCLSDESALSSNDNKPPRHFILISRPTTHSDVSPRNGYVLGHYESIEMIREVPLAKKDGDPETNPVEWIMITRSDPGGGIPRFMVERGTPDSIVADTTKFLKWALGRPEPSDDDIQAQEKKDEEHAKKAKQKQAEQPAQPAPSQDQPAQSDPAHAGIFGTLAGYTESAVATVAPSYLPTVQYALGTNTADNDGADDSSSDSGSSGYTSAEESLPSSPTAKTTAGVRRTPSSGHVSSSQHSLAAELESGQITPINSHEKNVVKLSRKRGLLDEKLAKAKEDNERKLKEAQTHDQEKLEKERQKLEAKHNKELEKLEKKQAKEERKAEEKRQKALSKDELHKAKVERDEYRQRAEVAEKDSHSYKRQIEELQRQNAAFVAKDEERRRGEQAALQGQSAASAAVEQHRARADAAERENLALRKQIEELRGRNAGLAQEANRVDVVQKPVPVPVAATTVVPVQHEVVEPDGHLPHRSVVMPRNGAQYFTQEGNA